jgi:uncharacterized membrane-anchored protein
MSTLIEITGPVKLDRRTKRLVHRLAEGDVAVVDHTDLDRVTAEELLETGVKVVVNVSESLSGRFPNPGPLLLVRGGVTLIDAPGAPLFDEVSEGEPITVRGASVFRNGTCLARGKALEERDLERALAEQRSRVTESLSEFAENTLQHLKAEGSLLSEGIDFPHLETRFRDRHALVVARGPGYKRDLRIVRPYIRDFKPVLVGVDGGADALIEAGYNPDVIVGDMDSVSDSALKSGAEVLVHGYHGNGNAARAASVAGRAGDARPEDRRASGAPGAARMEALDVPYQVVPSIGISEDLALLLAFEKGAELIVAVGTHFNLIEFLERNRMGMSSTFLTRLRVGEILVDAKGVSRLVSRRVGLWPLAALGLAGLGAIVVAVVLSPGIHHLIELAILRIRDWLGLG